MKYYRLVPIIFFLALLLGLSRMTPTRTEAATPALGLIAPGGPQPLIGTIDVSVVITGASNTGAFEFDLVYERTLLQVGSVTLGSFLGQVSGCNPASARCAVALGPRNAASGATSVGAYTFGSGAGATNNGVLAVIHLLPTGQAGTAHLSLINALVTDIGAASVAPSVQGARITLSSGGRLFLPLIRR